MPPDHTRPLRGRSGRGQDQERRRCRPDHVPGRRHGGLHQVGGESFKAGVRQGVCDHAHKRAVRAAMITRRLSRRYETSKLTMESKTILVLHHS